MIRISRKILIDESLIKEEFIRASGPGGQNVNKVATAVKLNFDVTGAHLPNDVSLRLKRLAGSRMAKDGTIIIHAKRFRTREKNRKDALERLIKMIKKSEKRPRIRKSTKPTLASKKKRVDSKRRRSQTKRMRSVDVASLM